MVCNFHEEGAKLKTNNNFCKHNVTLMDYPGQYQRWPVPKMEVICQFLKSCGNWLSCREYNVLLMHCDRGGGWHVLAFMLAALLIFRKQCNGEEMALDMVYKQAPREILHSMMPLDPISSQLRYLEYVSKWNVALDWPELDRALRLDCIILRYIPNFDGKGVCQPMFRIYGQDPARADKSSNILYSMPKRAKNVRAYKQGEYELIIVDINCHVKGDVLIESINLKGDMESEQMMFHTMFNTAFLRSNILMLNRDKVDILWDAKDQFPKDFRAEILFSEIDVATAVPENGTSWFEEKEGLPVEAFSKAQEIFSNGDWMSPREDPALQQRRASDIMQEKLDKSSDRYMERDTFVHRTGPKMPQEKKNNSKCFSPSNMEIQSGSSTKKKQDNDMSRKEEKNVEVDATPRQSSCSDSTTSMQRTGPKMSQEKKKEENCLMHSNLDANSVSSTKKTSDNGMSRKEDKTNKVGATPPRPSCSDSNTSLHQTGSKLPQEKSKEENSDLLRSLEVCSESSTKKSSDNGMIRKEDKGNKDDATPQQPSCSDSNTSLHQTGSKLPKEKSKEENADLPQSLEVRSVSSTKKPTDNGMIGKEDKANKDDATPQQPSCSDSTTSLHQTGSKLPQEKSKEENADLPRSLEVRSVSSTKKSSDNGMIRKEDKGNKDDATPQQPSCSDSNTSLHQTGSKLPEEKSKEENVDLPQSLDVRSVSSTKKPTDNGVIRKEDKANKDDVTQRQPSCSDSNTSLHQTGSKMPQEKSKEENANLPRSLEVRSVSSTKKSSDNGMIRKEGKANNDDTTPRQPSCSDSNTSLHETGSKLSEEKSKEENVDLPQSLEVRSVSSTKKPTDNGVIRKEDKANKDDVTQRQPSCSDSNTSLHQTGSKMPQEKSKEENADLPRSLEVRSVSSTKKSSNNGMIRKEGKTNNDDTTPRQPSCSDSNTSLHETGSKLPEEKSKEENVDLPRSLEVRSVSSTKKPTDNGVIRKEDKANKDDTTPRQPSCSDSTTSLHQTGSKMPRDKKKEESHFLPPNLEARSMSSTKKIPDNDISRNEDKTVKVDSTLQRPSSSNSPTSHQTGPIMPQGKKKEANSISSSNLESQFVPSTTKTQGNDMSTKQHKTIEVDATPPRPSSYDSITSSHQTGPTMPQYKKKQENEQTSDNYMSRKEDKSIKVDSTLQQPSSFNNSTTSSHQTDPTIPQGKNKETNSVLSSTSENQSVPSTKKTLDNDKSRKEDKTTKVDASPLQPISSNSISSSHLTDPTMPQKKKNEASCILPSNMEVQSVSSTKQNSNKDMSRKEDDAIKVDATLPRSNSSDSTTSFQQTGSQLHQEKEKEANCVLPSNPESKSMPSTKKPLDNDISRKEDNAIKVDATPPHSSSSDSTTSFNQTGSKMPQEKTKEANCILPSSLESKPMPSTNKIPDNDMSSKQNKTIKVEASPARSTSSDSTTSSYQTGSKMPHELKKEANCSMPSNSEIQSVSSTKHTPDNDMNRKEDKTIKADAALPGPESKSLYSKQHSSELSIPGSVDTSSSAPISPKTPPPKPCMTSSAKEVHDYPPHKESSSPMKSRNLVTEETESNSQDRSQSLNVTSKNGTASSCTNQNKSQADADSNPPACEITSTKVPPPNSPVSSPTCMKNILPVRTRLDSSPSKTQAPPSPHTPPQKDHEQIRVRHPPSPPTPPPKNETHSKAGPSPSPPPPPPPPCIYRKAESPTIAPPPPPPPPAAAENSSNSALHKSAHVPSAPAAPPPPTVYSKSGLRSDNGFPMSLSGSIDGNNMLGAEGRRSSPKGRTLSHIISAKNNTKKLKPLHWMKLSRAVKGSLWDETQKSDEASKAPEIDMSELENLFSAPVPSKGPAKKSSVQSSVGPKSDKVQLIDHTRAYNCEILLSKVKVPLQDLMSSVLTLEESVLDTDQVENLMKFCPTKEEIEVLKGYAGEKEKLGRCEQFFLELMKVPRVESKLRVFSFKIEFHSQRIMQTILSLGNALNQGTAKGSAIGFRLDSLLKLTETRSRNNKITLMHYLCKVLADKLPEVLDFSKDLANLEPAAKIQLKFLAEEMQAIRKGLEKVKHEQSSSENDGPISETFCKGGNVDALIIYFGEDPTRCPLEQVVTTLLNFTGMFNKANDENHNQLELEMKKTEESATKK
ncbi:hypothetical protein TanjilG_18788 [Lupinus angustifolius]|uniref:Formin-like protein n=1 Tax=Lupinus angustifolius TaxID=3871 RepID=A0A1J7H829_LUPAN|nr:hypothetical protein TanjilG_18788 [Lupinus angustifolius]